MKYEVREVLKSIEVIESSKELTSELRKTFATDFPMIKACVKENLIKDEAIALIQKIAPVCFKINGTVFLKGETKGEHDLIGDEMDYLLPTRPVEYRGIHRIARHSRNIRRGSPTYR